MTRHYSKALQKKEEIDTRFQFESIDDILEFALISLRTYYSKLIPLRAIELFCEVFSASNEIVYTRESLEKAIITLGLITYRDRDAKSGFIDITSLK